VDGWIDGPAEIDLERERERERERIFLIKNLQTLLSIKNKRIAFPPLKFMVFCFLSS